MSFLPHPINNMVLYIYTHIHIYIYIYIYTYIYIARTAYYTIISIILRQYII